MESKIIYIYGRKRGIGKTSLNTCFAIQEMLDSDLFQESLFEIESLKAKYNRDFTLPDVPHFIFSNYAISYTSPYGEVVKTWGFDPLKFKWPGPNEEYDIFAPGSHFHITECQTVYNSRMFKKFSKSVYALYEASRHVGFSVTLDGLGLDTIDKRIRSIVDFFITTIDFQQTVYEGRIVSSTWKCLVFDNIYSAEQYEQTKDISFGQQVDYTFDTGCIFDCYDSRQNKHLYYRDALEKDFSFVSSDEFENVNLVPTKEFYSEET